MLEKNSCSTRYDLHELSNHTLHIAMQIGLYHHDSN